jgi:arginyl-tRNA--protein-N-Asp/Glu arginylyltransferase
VSFPLRIFVPDFRFSRSQRKNLSRNSDLRIENRPIIIDDEKLDLFDRHKQRFAEHVPESIYTFLSTSPASVPSEAFEICVYEGEKLLAVSFYNLGEESVSGIYAMFEPAELKRGLGILTMLLEIQFAQETNRKFYYQGYAYEGPSFYDYKKRFNSLEMYDWEGNWLAFSE